MKILMTVIMTMVMTSAMAGDCKLGGECKLEADCKTLNGAYKDGKCFDPKAQETQCPAIVSTAGPKPSTDSTDAPATGTKVDAK